MQEATKDLRKAKVWLLVALLFLYSASLVKLLGVVP